MNPISLLICTRVYLFGEGLKGILYESEEFNIIGIANNEHELRSFLQFDPNVIIADQAFCHVIFEKFFRKEPYNILLISDQLDPSRTLGDLQGKIAKGLSGILPRDSDSYLLKKAIRAVFSGELWIDHKTIKKSLTRNGEQKNIRLTKRELEIFQHVRSGNTNREIAKKLCISEQTVKSHCNHLFKKFGVSSRLKLALCSLPDSINNMN